MLGAIQDGPPSPIYLVRGDRVVSEPAAARLGEKLAGLVGCDLESHRRPPDLGDILADLQTFSLFATGKVVLASETAVLADLSGAAALIDDAAEAVPLSAGEGALSGSEKRSALRLLQALRLFELDPYAGAASEVLARLPDWALQGGAAMRKKARRRSAAQVKKLRGGLEPLLEQARSDGLEGRAEGTVALLMELLHKGLPDGHHLVLAESTVADEHPIVQALEERGALVSAGGIEVDRKGFRGLEAVAGELERQTGVSIDPAALGELAKRTLRRESRGRAETVAADSSGRLAAEYRKLATLAGSGKITVDLVTETVEDRGDEDVWQVLDAIGSGRPGNAIERIDRLMAASEDPVATRLSLFSLVASFCRQVSVIGGLLAGSGVRRGERSYQRFKANIAPKLQEPLAGDRPNPLAGLHPFRLYRAYLAASALPAPEFQALPKKVLDTELRLKGDSRAPETVLTAFVAELATAMSRR